MTRRALLALAADHRSGSVTLALRACELLSRCGLPKKKYADKKASEDSSRRVAQRVAEAQPAMAAVRNVCGRWLRRVQRGDTPLTAARRTARELHRAQQASARHAARLIHSRQTVMTYSASSTVETALRLAHRSGRRFRLLCAEGRPMYEGRAMARRLVAEGLAVELFTDAALLASLSQADLLLLGADAIFPRSFFNKVGTHALVRMARAERVSAYIVADSFKLLPAAARGAIAVQEEASSEAWKHSRKNLRIRNFYFEQVPLRLVSGLILEQGECRVREVPAYINALMRAMTPGACLRYAQRQGGGRIPRM